VVSTSSGACGIRPYGREHSASEDGGSCRQERAYIIAHSATHDYQARARDVSDMTLPDQNLHPRPQQARDHWLDLRGRWQFAHDDDARGLAEKWYERTDVFDREIQVPFPPESSASGIGDLGFHPVMWYRRTFTLRREGESQQVLLHFGAVDYWAEVWVNGTGVGTHAGGQTPFCFEISSALEGADEHVLVVRAEDPPDDLSLPRGKQDWNEVPHNIWYNRTSGIWQPVWIELVRAPYIMSLQWHPDLHRGMLGMSLRLAPHTEPAAQVRVQLHLAGSLLLDDLFFVHETEIRRDFALDLGKASMTPGQLPWSPEAPNLIEATVSVLVDKQIRDQMKGYAGMRSVGVSAGRFLLNRRPYYLRLALEQGYWPDTHLAAPSDEALRLEVERAKELGFNGVRVHQKVEDPRFLYWCDRLGLLVWGEMANAYVFNPTSVKRLTREWMDVVERDYSHPCIVAWVPLNESWGVPNLLNDEAQREFARSLYHLTKALDPSRPCIGNDGWEYLVGDMCGIHDYAFDGRTIRERYETGEAILRTVREVQPGGHVIKIGGDELHADTAFILSEFGGIGYRPDRGKPWFGYGTVETEEEFREKYQELVQAVLDCPPLAGFCYTQLTDTLQETNGLLTEDRNFKFDPAAVRAVTGPAAASDTGDIVDDLRAKGDPRTSDPGGE
jgi:Glycosyl hydrolases family 2, sugar binding domain/Glycosyl hydrolases family 2, TIM barrel domain